MRRLILALIVLALAAAGGGLYWLRDYAERPIALPVTPFEFTVAQGSTLKQVARKLNAAGLLREPLSFTLLARMLDKSGQIKAGTYHLDGPVTPRELLDKLGRGEVEQISITFIEGRTFAEMRKVLDGRDDIGHRTAGLTDQEILQLVGAEETHPEGLFFPDTYMFRRGTSDVEVLKRAYRTMREHLDKQWQERVADLPLSTPYEALILASVVEKETGKAQERPQIAAVFTNRLRKRMRLQTDPTIIYGLGASFDGNLTKKHLQTDGPYNSYTRGGLPPTPIAMPGLDAIKAVMQPAQSNDLYFVSRGDGSHVFSATLNEHNQAVNKYQR